MSAQREGVAMCWILCMTVYLFYMLAVFGGFRCTCYTCVSTGSMCVHAELIIQFFPSFIDSESDAAIAGPLPSNQLQVFLIQYV